MPLQELQDIMNDCMTKETETSDQSLNVLERTNLLEVELWPLYAYLSSRVLQMKLSEELCSEKKQKNLASQLSFHTLGDYVTRLLPTQPKIQALCLHTANTELVCLPCISLSSN